MAYCKNCGKEVSEFAANCPECGSAQTKQNQNRNVSVVDNGGFGWGLLGFCIPLVGLILWIIWKDEKPNTAKSLITGAAIGFALSFVSAIFSVM